MERRIVGSIECKICAHILNIRKLTTEQRKQLLELLEAQDQQALQETEWYRQKYIKTANENGGGRRRNGYPLPLAFWTARLLEAK